MRTINEKDIEIVKACENCEHMRAIEADQHRGIFCGRFPPVVVVMPIDNALLARATGVRFGMMSRLPNVLPPGLACGEWERSKSCLRN